MYISGEGTRGQLLRCDVSGSGLYGVLITGGADSTLTSCSCVFLSLPLPPFLAGRAVPFFFFTLSPSLPPPFLAGRVGCAGLHGLTGGADSTLTSCSCVPSLPLPLSPFPSFPPPLAGRVGLFFPLFLPLFPFSAGRVGCASPQAYANAPRVKAAGYYTPIESLPPPPPFLAGRVGRIFPLRSPFLRPAGACPPPLTSSPPHHLPFTPAPSVAGFTA